MEQNTNTLPDIKQSVELHAPIKTIWDMVSNSENIASWFMPNNFELKAGFEFHINSPFGPSPCKVIEFDVPHRLSFRWDTDGWVITFLLKELDDQHTEFTLVHSGWKEADRILPKANEKSSVIRERMNEGWKVIISDRLTKVVEGK
ncbi:uncharacterized protein YndB with AHSA1/START domain [Croceifilum oryzae]|uniref:Uncharacterized protein YndB with AHSA1/START domain n=1 Tax=Croceifilum oryzae TaxID=1553429 RepID=A0AAJ1WPL0_9BACL|nr:SRPBCC domain-containing protein [Croceifilum oryzae]MDQ0416637.1 uncharacterized protein YndB with AHSA1/START domain [Croceifilum oryzae]